MRLLKLGGKVTCVNQLDFCCCYKWQKLTFTGRKRKFWRYWTSHRSNRTVGGPGSEEGGALADTGLEVAATPQPSSGSCHRNKWTALLFSHQDPKSRSERGLPGSNKSLTLGEEDTWHFQLRSPRTPHSGDKRIPKMKLGCCYQKEGNKFWQLKSKRCSLKYLTFC